MMMCPNCFGYYFNGSSCSVCKYVQKEMNHEDLKLFYTLKNRYRIGRSIGAGGFGITYVAYDTLNDIRVCVKEYFPMGIVMRSGDGITLQFTRQSRGDDFRHGIQRFLEEATVISEMNNISGIVNVLDSFEANGTAYYVMEYLEGVSLKRLVPEGGMQLNAATEIICKVGRNIDLIHKEKGYLHRDISPENIMILPTGRVVLIDFGSAKNFFMSNSNYTITLKHGFAPIEQYSSTDSQGPFTDLYALASTYYYILTRKVIPRATDRLAGVTYTPLCQFRSDISRELSDVVDRALAVNPAERTQTVLEFVDQLTAASSHGAVAQKNCVKVSIMGKIVSSTNIEPDKWLTVGRSSKSDIVFPECQNVTRVHCRLMFDSVKQQYCIEDCSTNGTYINRIRMEKGTRYYVSEKDVIILANANYRLVLGG